MALGSSVQFEFGTNRLNHVQLNLCLCVNTKWVNLTGVL